MHAGRTRQLTSVRETTFGTTPASPTMAVVRALKDYKIANAPGMIESAEIDSTRMKKDVRNGNKKGDFNIPFQLSYGDFDAFFEETLCGTWAPVASFAGNITVAASGKTFTKVGGTSFITLGFAVGQEIQTSGFGTSANNGKFILSAVAANVLTCSTATGLADETGTNDTIATTMEVLKVGNTFRSRSFEDQNPDANLYELYNGCVFDGFDLDISPEKIVTGTFKGITRDCVLAGVSNAAISVDSSGKTFTCAAGGFLATGASFAVGMNIVTSGFTNAANNGTFVITAVTDTVITCSAATLTTEVAGTGKSILMGSVDADPTAASDNAPYDSYTGDLLEGTVDQTEGTALKLSFQNNMKATYCVLTSGADAAAAIRPDNDISCTGEVSIYFENQNFKKKFLGGTESILDFTLGSGLPGGKSMRFLLSRIRYTGNERDTGSTIVEKAPFMALKHAASATCLAIYRIP